MFSRIIKTGTFGVCRHQAALRKLVPLNVNVRVFGTSTEDESTAALLLQKNLIQRNNMLYGHGSGTIRCTVFDASGNIISPSLDIKREELVMKHGLLPRDLRKIEKSRKNDLVPSFLVRKNGILVSLVTIKTLIKPDMVIVFDSFASLNSTMHKSFLNNLKLRLQNQDTLEVKKDPLPYEFRALESIFISAISNLTSEMNVQVTICKGVLQDLEYSITRDKLKFLLSQNKKLSNFYKKTVLIRDMLDDLLEQSDLLCEMYLTDKKNGIEHEDDDHTEIEMLLETYHHHLDEIVQITENVISNVKTTEEIINIILDSNRNQLMLLGIKFSIGMLSLGGPIFLGSLYGMNLENFIEETNYGYIFITTLGLASMAVLYFFCIRRLHKLQKMSLFNYTREGTKK
ncbi:hypothetical protein RNJ44_03793 [Nakaseomyces bracarensis]|uniref:Magnesium transporter n=1 Tax=Nakaseomyces bracarensis TaxID=273131 RepID=A0ABR4NYD5_9SACH